jgi:hypothetical protein
MLQAVTQRTVMRMILVTTYSQTVNTSSILHILHNLYHVSPSLLAIFNNVLHTITGIKTIVFNIQLDFMLHEELHKFGPHVVPKTMQRRQCLNNPNVLCYICGKEEGPAVWHTNGMASANKPC